MSLPDPASRPCITADEAFAHLGIERNTGYRAIRAGTFPLPVIRVGRVIRVPTAALRSLLLGDLSPHRAERERYPDRTDTDRPSTEVDDDSEPPRPLRAHRDGTPARQQGARSEPSTGAA